MTTGLTAIGQTVDALRTAFDSGATKPLGWRVAQLRALRQLLTERAPELEDALLADLAKNPTESQIAEIGFCLLYTSPSPRDRG